jgi:hypothetical protein
MLKTFALFFIAILLSSCSGNFEKNRAKLDEVYGECDNPVRSLSERKYKECLAYQKGGGESLFDLENSFSNAFGGGNNVVYQYSVNPYLWQAALETTNVYSLKIADNNGGLVETDWIYDSSSVDRCLIKIRILSQELVSNGVTTNFICETKINDNWIRKDQSYKEEENQITLKILSTASKLSQTQI